MRRLTAVIAAALTAWGMVFPAAAEDGATLLQQFLQETPSAKVTFHQTALDHRGNVVGESRGRFWHRRPRSFRMEYDPPDGIVMVSNGEQTWTYERDLDQVIIQSADVLAGASVLLDVLASGDLEDLRDSYLLASGTGGELRWAVAEAKTEEQAIQTMRLGFAPDGRLLRVELTDSFGSQAHLKIESVTPRVADDAIFVFNPPIGADIVEEQ